MMVFGKWGDNVYRNSKINGVKTCSKFNLDHFICKTNDSFKADYLNLYK